MRKMKKRCAMFPSKGRRFNLASPPPVFGG